MVDQKAIKILFKRYWSSSGWTNTYLSKAEIDYAKDAGVMFETREITHDGIIEQIREMINKLDFNVVIEQFVASLSTRRLDLRSALGSYIVGKHLVEHPFIGENHYCEYCGFYNEIEDLNVLSFERFKWGGVRHLDPVYIAFDLKEFARTEKAIPTVDDYQILDEIITTIQALPSTEKIRRLEKSLSQVLKSNKEEREILLQILGYCSILSTTEHPGFLEEFIPFIHREHPGHYKNDWAYPVSLWTGSDRLRMDAVNQIFRPYLTK